MDAAARSEGPADPTLVLPCTGHVVADISRLAPVSGRTTGTARHHTHASGASLHVIARIAHQKFGHSHLWG